MKTNERYELRLSEKASRAVDQAAEIAMVPVSTILEDQRTWAESNAQGLVDRHSGLLLDLIDFVIPYTNATKRRQALNNIERLPG